MYEAEGLSPSQVAARLLARDRDGKPGAMDGLLRIRQPLARKLPARFARGTEPFEDVVQVACVVHTAFLRDSRFAGWFADAIDQR